MEEKMRNMGIGVIGSVPWGTHFCQFYRTKEDLIDILVPYFKAGLENNELCMWVTSEPLTEREAERAMRKAVPNFAAYSKRSQIEFIPHSQWYLEDGAFSLQRVLNVWIDKVNQAVSGGFDGIRVTGNTAWLEQRVWESFVEYEEEVNRTVAKYRMIAICTYRLDRCGASEIIDVASNHQFSLIRRDGKWKVIEDSEHRYAKDKMSEHHEFLRDVLESLTPSFLCRRCQ